MKDWYKPLIVIVLVLSIMGPITYLKYRSDQALRESYTPTGVWEGEKPLLWVEDEKLHMMHRTVLLKHDLEEALRRMEK